MSRRLRADLSLAICSLLGGATFVVVKNALDHASALKIRLSPVESVRLRGRIFMLSGCRATACRTVFIFLAVRFSVATVLMLAWSTRALRLFEREDLFAGLRLGAFMFLGYAFQTAGLQYTTPAKSGS